jgi:hypothetical protein
VSFVLLLQLFGGFFEQIDAFGQVAVGAGTEGEIERGAHEGGAAGLDVVFGGKQVDQGLDGLLGG